MKWLPLNSLCSPRQQSRKNHMAPVPWWHNVRPPQDVCGHGGDLLSTILWLLEWWIHGLKMQTCGSARQTVSDVQSKPAFQHTASVFPLTWPLYSGEFGPTQHRRTIGQAFALYRAYSMIIRTTDFVGRRLVCACTYVHVLSMHKTGNCLMIVDFLQLQMCEMEKWNFTSTSQYLRWNFFSAKIWSSHNS